MATWEQIREEVFKSYRVHRDYGNGFGLWVDTPGRPQLVLVTTNNPVFSSVEYVTFEVILGPVENVNPTMAAQSASKLLGGSVCFDGTFSLRESRCLETLTIPDFGTCLNYLAGAAVGYLVAAGQL
jgi:hypothetical protein